MFPVELLPPHTRLLALGRFSSTSASGRFRMSDPSPDPFH